MLQRCKDRERLGMILHGRKKTKQDVVGQLPYGGSCKDNENEQMLEDAKFTLWLLLVKSERMTEKESFQRFFL